MLNVLQVKLFIIDVDSANSFKSTIRIMVEVHRKTQAFNDFDFWTEL